jgi:hypothetical protein
MLESKAEMPYERTISARIRIVDNLRGISKVATMRYSAHLCCGTRLDLGKYYAAFDADATDDFFGSPGNLMEIGEMYGRESSQAIKLRSVVAGKETLEHAFGEFPSERLMTIPRPPDPCPVAKTDQK